MLGSEQGEGRGLIRRKLMIMDSPEYLSERFSVDLTVKKIHWNSLNQGRDHQRGVWGCFIMQEELKSKSFRNRALGLQESGLALFPCLVTESRVANQLLHRFLPADLLFPISNPEWRLPARIACIWICNSKSSFLLKNTLMCSILSGPHFIWRRNVTSNTLTRHILGLQFTSYLKG